MRHPGLLHGSLGVSPSRFSPGPPAASRRPPRGAPGSPPEAPPAPAPSSLLPSPLPQDTTRGYRDAALAAVRRQAARWELPLTVVAYADLFGGWTMDAVARSTAGSGRSRACCTFCGVLRRRALEEGARLVGATHVVTGERRRGPERAWWEGRMRRIGHRKGAGVRAQVVKWRLRVS